MKPLKCYINHIIYMIMQLNLISIFFKILHFKLFSFGVINADYFSSSTVDNWGQSKLRLDSGLLIGN